MYLIPDHIYNLLMDWLSLSIVAVSTLLNSAQECFGLWNLRIYTVEWCIKGKIELFKSKPKHGGRRNILFEQCGFLFEEHSPTAWKGTLQGKEWSPGWTGSHPVEKFLFILLGSILVKIFYLALFWKYGFLEINRIDDSPWLQLKDFSFNSIFETCLSRWIHII